MKRTELRRKTPLKAGKPLARSRIARKPPPHGFPEEVRMIVRRRCGGRCEVGSEVCTGRAEHLHHRKLRRHKDHSEANALYCCQPCHLHIHQYVTKAYLMGWLVHATYDPALVPVKPGSRLC
jgi:hypothetical protein